MASKERSADQQERAGSKDRARTGQITAMSRWFTNVITMRSAKQEAEVIIGSSRPEAFLYHAQKGKTASG